MWDLPGPDIKPMSPVFTGGFFTTVPPGKSESTRLLRSTEFQTHIFLEYDSPVNNERQIKTVINIFHKCNAQEFLVQMKSPILFFKSIYYTL